MRQHPLSGPRTGARRALLLFFTPLVVFAASSPAAARTLIAEPPRLSSGPTLAADGVAWSEGSYDSPIEVRLGAPGQSPRTVQRIAPPRGRNLFHDIGSLSGSPTNLAFIRSRFRSTCNGDACSVQILGGELFSGPPDGPFASSVRGAFGSDDACSEESADPEDADVDGGTAAVVELVRPCVDGTLRATRARLSTIDLATGQRTTLAESAPTYGPRQVRIEGDFVAWSRRLGPRLEAEVRVFDRATASEAYSVTIEEGAWAIDVQADGKLAVMRNRVRDGLTTGRTTPTWFSSQEPYAHPLPFRSSDIDPIEISGDRLVFGRLRGDGTTELMLSTLTGTPSTVARFTKNRRLGGNGTIDFDGTSLTYAERLRTAAGKTTRIYLDDLPG